MGSRILEIIWYLFLPIQFWLISASFLPGTIYHGLQDSQYSIFASWSAFKDAWFARFWGKYGPLMREGASGRVAPLLEGARGVVLDIGPGGGEWVHQFDLKKVTKIFGVEPNRDHHAGLKAKVKAAGLEDIYEIVPVGVEDLGSRWVGQGEVDTIITLQCLCSVDEPKRMIKELYDYLKVGGSWIVYEHVVIYEKQGKWLALYQQALDLLHPTFVGGCRMTRDTGRWLQEVGAWSKVDLAQPADEDPWHLVPHTMGLLTK